jgi:site-specific recombinase XerD
MNGSVHFKADRRQWVVAWSWEGKRHQISRYKGRLMEQTSTNKERCQGYRDAQRLLHQMQGDVENGVFRIERFTGKRWTDIIPFLDQWLETKANKKPATIALYRNFIRNHIKPFFEQHPIQLHEVQLDTLDALRMSLDMNPWSAYLCMSTFKQVLNYAWRSKRIPEVPPFPRKSEYQIQDKPIRWLSSDRQNKVLESIPDEHNPIFLFLKYHLRRPAEAMAMQKTDYNRFNSSFAIRRSISADVVVEATKTGAVHIVPCHAAFKGHVEKILREDANSPFLFVNRLARTPGKRYTHKALALIWRKACKAANEPYIELYAGLKHSSMSQYINEKGLMLAELQMISRHAKIESVKKYVDVGLERIRELMETEPVEAEKIRKVK